MMTKKVLALCIIVAFSTTYSCVDRLTFYNKDYKPKLHPELRFDGYYTKKEMPWSMLVTHDSSEIWANPITPRFFYGDGLVAYCGTHKDEQYLTETMVKYNGGSPVWGAYKISNDTITTETIEGNSGTMRAERKTNKFTIKKDTLFLFMFADRKGKATSSVDTLYFHLFSYKPDSSKSFIRRMKRYN